MPNIPTTDSLADTGINLGAPNAPRGGRSNQATGFQDGTVNSNDPIDDATQGESSRSTQAVSASFRRQLLDAQSRDKLSSLGEEYLEKFSAQLEKDGLHLTPVAINGAYIARDDRYGIMIVFEEASHRSTANEFTPQANIIGRIMNDNVVRDQIKGMDVEVLTGILITPEDYGTKDDTKYALAANRIRNYVNLSLGAEVSIEELERYQFRIITNPSVVEQNLIKYSPHGVAPYFMYGACVEVCMDERIKEGRRSRRDYNEDDYEWLPLFTIGAMTEFERYDEDDLPNRPIVTITAYEGSFLSVKLLPFVIAVASEIFIYQELWLEPFRNFGPEGYNLGELYVDDTTGRPSRLENRRDMKEFMKNYVGRPVLCVDVQNGRFTFPGFEILANADITRLQEELDCLNGDQRLTVDDPVKTQIEYYTGFVVDDGQLRDSRSIHYFRLISDHSDPELLDRFRNYFDNPEDRIKAISEAGFNNYQGRTKLLTTVYPTTKYLLDADAILRMTDMTSVLNILRNTTRDNNPAFTSDLLNQQATILRERERSLYSNRASSNQRSTGIVFGGGMRGRGRR